MPHRRQERSADNARTVAALHTRLRESVEEGRVGCRRRRHAGPVVRTSSTVRARRPRAGHCSAGRVHRPGVGGTAALHASRWWRAAEAEGATRTSRSRRVCAGDDQESRVRGRNPSARGRMGRPGNKAGPSGGQRRGAVPHTSRRSHGGGQARQPERAGVRADVGRNAREPRTRHSSCLTTSSPPPAGPLRCSPTTTTDMPRLASRTTISTSRPSRGAPLSADDSQETCSS